MFYPLHPFPIPPAQIEEVPEENSEPEHKEPTSRTSCDHQKVYPVRIDGPYPWICVTCLAVGEDAHLPVVDPNLFEKLKSHLEISGRAPVGGRRLRSCYYCGGQVVGSVFDSQPARCGKCT